MTYFWALETLSPAVDDDHRLDSSIFLFVPPTDELEHTMDWKNAKHFRYFLLFFVDNEIKIYFLVWLKFIRPPSSWNKSFASNLPEKLRKFILPLIFVTVGTGDFSIFSTRAKNNSLKTRVGLQVLLNLISYKNIFSKESWNLCIEIQIWV